jgi:hypothetical protein
VPADLYIIDANVLIEAANKYYAFGVVPRFWDWLDEQAEAGTVRSVSMVAEEIDAPPELVEWVKEREGRDLFIDVSDPAIQKEYKKLAATIIAGEFGPEHIAKFLNGADLWIIASALVHKATVVTQEVPVGPGSKKIKIPDVCRRVEIAYIDTFTFLGELDATF